MGRKSKAPESPLKLTGERTLPGIPRENYWFQRHVAAYQFARRYIGGLLVLDVGCGEGYGPAMLCRDARKVIGVDIAPEVIEHARAKYRAENLEFALMDVTDLKFDDSFAEAVVCLQVIEHIEREEPFLSEVCRVLKPGGTLVLSTPNRNTISPGRAEPVNPFHFREYTPPELASRLSGFFDDVRLFGLFHAGWLRFNEKARLVDFVKVYEMGRLNPRLWMHRVLTPLVRSSDFEIAEGGRENCLDIIAVCRKGAFKGQS